MKKKIVSLTLVLALCLSLLPVTAFAEGDDEASTEVKTWGDLADTSWYTGNEDAAEYHITTAAQLAGLAELINKENASVSFDGKTVYLDSDLDLAGHEWISIGNGLAIQNAHQHDPDWYYSFNGTFDGQGHVIYNLYSHDSLLDNDECFDGNIATSHGRDVYKTGLFGYLYKGTIKNLGIKDADIWIDSNDVSTYGEGILADYIEDSTIENCWTTGSITGGSYFEQWIGGIVGNSLGTCKISGCYSSAKIVGNYLGKGYNVPGGAVPMQYFDSLGGIAGGIPIYGTLDISDCWFDGKITVNSIQAAVGGIVGYADTATVKNCMVVTEDIDRDPVTEEVNTCWLAYIWAGNAENNYWPANDKYEATPLSGSAGMSVSNFTSADVFAGLRANAAQGVEWVAGITHPTFEWDVWHILADYTEVDKAIAAAEAIDGSLYSNYSDVEAAIKAVDRTKSKAEQAEVDAMAQKINDAIAALEKKPSSSSSGSSRPRYDVTTPSKPENGSVTVDPERARSGSRVTVTVTPDSGYKLGELVVTDKDGKKLELTDKGNGQYTFTMPSGKVEVAAEFVKEVEVSPFADVATDAYYYDAVKWAVEKGVTNGVSETLFGPDQACTRAQIVTFLWRAAGSPEPKSGSSFADVAADAYYAKAVAWAVENGITKGTSETTFHPDETCTRAQSVTFLYRALGKLAAAQAGFTDVAADSYYADAVNWAAENGVTNGISETLFGPDGSCTRAQIVTFLYRAYQGK